MKKRLYILMIVVLAVGFVGCHKVDINPHECENERTFENNEKGKNTNDADGEFDRDGDDGGGVITDPNHDEDEDEQVKK